MSRRANAWDNAPMESFFKTLKVERIYEIHYETRAQAHLPTAIGFLTPVDYEAALVAA